MYFYNDLTEFPQLGAVTRDGRPGANARDATPGTQAGLLAVELTQSTTVQGSIHVDVARFESTQQPGGPFDVPIRRDILLTAIGGNGENGLDGGNGQRGIDGVSGTAATRVADATVG
jgi:hypothetical protein